MQWDRITSPKFKLSLRQKSFPVRILSGVGESWPTRGGRIRGSTYIYYRGEGGGPRHQKVRKILNTLQKSNRKLQVRKSLVNIKELKKLTATISTYWLGFRSHQKKLTKVSNFAEKMSIDNCYSTQSLSDISKKTVVLYSAGKEEHFSASFFRFQVEIFPVALCELLLNQFSILILNSNFKRNPNSKFILS